jgi:tetratricopeptide (TPR) repeat protein
MDQLLGRRPRTVAALAIVASLSVAPLFAQGGGISDHGFPALFGFGEVTVVYPNGSEQAEMNRISAEDRAEFLRSAGVDATVAADDRITAAQLEGHLLVLGWDNRVVARDRVKAPFSRVGKGFSFLGIVERSENADLAVFHRSPYNPGRFLAFWSRIDPELDRFMMLPNVGSDWAIFHDYLPVRQGMFEPNPAWPPVRKQSAEKDHALDLAQARAARAERRSEHYTLRYDPTEISPDGAARILAAREKGLAAATAALGVDPKDHRITLEVFGTVDGKVALTGVPDAVHSHPRRPELYMLARVSTNPSPHEEIHIVARKVLGPAYLSALVEGLSLDEENDFRGTSLDLFAAILVEQGRMPGLEEILPEGRYRALPEGARYPAAGLLVRWLRSTWGDERFRSVYGLRVGTTAELARALGRPAAGLTGEFRTWVEGVATTQAQEIAYIKVMSRAREQHLAADHEGMVASMHQALELKPDDPHALQNLAAAEMRLGRYADAEKHLGRLLALDLPDDSRFRIFGTWDLGRIYDLQGRRDEALAQYRRVLELPDLFELHLLARDALEYPVTPESLE